MIWWDNCLPFIFISEGIRLKDEKLKNFPGNRNESGNRERNEKLKTWSLIERVWVRWINYGHTRVVKGLTSLQMMTWARIGSYPTDSSSRPVLFQFSSEDYSLTTWQTPTAVSREILHSFSTLVRLQSTVYSSRLQTLPLKLSLISNNAATSKTNLLRTQVEH